MNYIEIINDNKDYTLYSSLRNKIGCIELGVSAVSFIIFDKIRGIIWECTYELY